MESTYNRIHWKIILKEIIKIIKYFDEMNNLDIG
jgi:hypothetical protein